MEFHQQCDKVIHGARGIPSHLAIVRLESWLPRQPNRNQLYRDYQRSMPNYHLSRPTTLPTNQSLLALVDRSTSRLISLLHVSILASPSEPDNRCCYLASSSTPDPKDRGSGFNTVLRLVAIKASQHAGLSSVISTPCPGAPSDRILTKLQFSQQGGFRILTLTDTPTCLTEGTSLISWPQSTV
jgi:hypothetical protein